MTKEEFNNQQWYKSKVVYLNNEPYYAVAVWFFDEEIKLSKTTTDDNNGFWVPRRFISVNKPEPTAIDLISAEREKQISKGYTVEHDQNYAHNGGTSTNLIVWSLICANYDSVPKGWDNTYWFKLCNRPYKDRVRIAATLFAAELDRILYLENKEETK